MRLVTASLQKIVSVLAAPFTSTLNGERWNDVPAAVAPAKLEKGEVRVRESKPQEVREAEQRTKFLALMHANPGKSEAEIAAMMQETTEHRG